MRHDQANDTYIIASGFDGEKAQWFQNLMKTPDVTIQVGRRKLAALRPPAVPGRKWRNRIMPAATNGSPQSGLVHGIETDGTEAGYRALGQQLPFIAHPLHEHDVLNSPGGFIWTATTTAEIIDLWQRAGLYPTQ